MDKALKLFENAVSLGLFILFVIELHKFATTDSVVSGIWAILLLKAASNIHSNTKVKITVGERK